MPHTNLRAVGYSGFLNVRNLTGNFPARHCQNLQFLSGCPKGLGQRACFSGHQCRAGRAVLSGWGIWSCAKDALRL